MSYSFYYPSAAEIKENFRVDSLKYDSDRITKEIEELKKVQKLIMDQANRVMQLDSKVVIHILRHSYPGDKVTYDVETNRVFIVDGEEKRTYIGNKRFGASREEKAALKQYVKDMEAKYKTKCNADYKKLKL